MKGSFFERFARPRLLCSNFVSEMPLYVSMLRTACDSDKLKFLYCPYSLPLSRASLMSPLMPEPPDIELEVWLSSENKRICASQMCVQASILSLTVWMASSTIALHFARMAAIVFSPSAPEVTSDSREAWNESVPSSKCMSIGISRIFFWRELEMPIDMHFELGTHFQNFLLERIGARFVNVTDLVLNLAHDGAAT